MFNDLETQSQMDLQGTLFYFIFLIEAFEKLWSHYTIANLETI
jgi:hypothetical protein